MRDSGILNRILKKAKRRLAGGRGFTMAEMLIVVAMIAVLGGLTFVAVNRYQRSMGQLERDAIAKQIFVAAQNHLSAAKGEGYLGKPVKEAVTGEKEAGDIYYIVVNHGRTLSDANAFASVSADGKTVEPILNDMLPFGSVDETVRIGGNYVIRYYREAGIVKDVFYCTQNASPSQFNHSFAAEELPAIFTTHVGPEKKNERATYLNNSILGWYGGADVETLDYKELEPPEIELVNAERLYVRIKDPNLTPSVSLTQGDLRLRLLVKGESSGREHYLDIDRFTGAKDTEGWFIAVLDDITARDLHFCNRVFDDMKATAPDTSNGFFPGENITVQAMVYGEVKTDSQTVYVPAYSAKETANSLFASVADTNSDKKLDTANIANIRHLENLDAAVSKLGENDKIAVTAAVQTDNLIWKDSDSGTKDFVSEIRRQKELTDDPVVTGWAGGQTSAGSYLPVALGSVTSYDGRAHSVTGVTADGSFTGGTAKTDVGLFDALSGQSVSNLQLLDFTVTSTNNAGALAGSAVNTTVTNILARNSSKTGAATDITAANGSAGGLIGSVTGGSVENSAAALSVNGSENAGGLIGTASGNVTVSRCYSGGHTKNGNYRDWVSDNRLYDVTGATAGGLVGSFEGEKIENSYSTCSVSGTTAAGGFAGTAAVKNPIANCYCTGFVSGTRTEGAFAGSLSGTASGCRYFEIVNERADARTGHACLKAVGNQDRDGITQLDNDMSAYEGVVSTESAWDSASAYDVNLRIYYKNKFPLQTVFQLGKNDKTLTSGKTEFVRTHFGDWPAPETFVINN